MFVESVSNADEQLGEMFLEEKTPTMDDIHVSSHLYFSQIYKECVIFDRPWLSVCVYLYIRGRETLALDGFCQHFLLVVQ